MYTLLFSVSIVKFLRVLSPSEDSFSFISIVWNISRSELWQIKKADTNHKTLSHRFALISQTHLPFTSLQDCINVIICDLTLFGGEHMCGTMTDDGQHLILAQLVSARIHKSPC